MFDIACIAEAPVLKDDGIIGAVADGRCCLVDPAGMYLHLQSLSGVWSAEQRYLPLRVDIHPYKYIMRRRVEKVRKDKKERERELHDEDCRPYELCDDCV